MLITSIDLEITSRCNLACPYCYVGIGKLAAQGSKLSAPGSDMSQETIDQVLRLIEKRGRPRPLKAQGSGLKAQRPTHIDFYGGEPFCAFAKVRYTIEESRRRGMELTFGLLSNGTLGTQEQFDYLAAHRCHVQRSIDGHPAAQEKYRPGSAEKYLEVGKLCRDFQDTRRMTIQPEFAGEILRSFLWFEEQGYGKGISPQPNFYAEWSNEQVAAFKRSLWDLGRYYLRRWKRGDPFYVYYFARSLEARYGKPIGFGCGAARSLHCVSWDGWIFACHRFSRAPHDSPFCYGSIAEALAGTAKGYGVELLARALASNEEKHWRPECRYCIAQKACNKGCYHVNQACTGSLAQPPPLFCAIRQETEKVVDWLDGQLRRIDPRWYLRGNTCRLKRAVSCEQ
jgi:radical SAM protein with 4Fe4S-binding SPASM domain